MNPIKTLKYKNRKLIISYDENPESPREWDNLGIMDCSHKRYNLGDKTDTKHENFNNWEEVKQYLITEKKAEIIFPLYLYDHSGITISINSFNDRWDSGQVGFIYITKELIKKEFGKLTIKKATEILKREVEIYDQYLRGEVYSYKLYELDKCKCCKHTEEVYLDGCSGYYNIESIESEIKDFKKYKEVKE